MLAKQTRKTSYSFLSCLSLNTVVPRHPTNTRTICSTNEFHNLKSNHRLTKYNIVKYSNYKFHPEQTQELRIYFYIFFFFTLQKVHLA